jgi:hypothetical protein
MKKDFGKSACITISAKSTNYVKLLSTALQVQITSLGYIGTSISMSQPVITTAQRDFHWDSVSNKKGKDLLKNVYNTGVRYNKDFWISRVLDEIVPSRVGYPFDFVIIEDCGIPNEIEYIKSNPLYDVYAIKLFDQYKFYYSGKNCQGYAGSWISPSNLLNVSSVIIKNILSEHTLYG